MARVRTSFSLPPEIVRQLDYVSGRMGVTRSALVADVLGDALGPLCELLRSMPDDPPAPGSDAALRARGASEDVIRGRLEALREVVGELDPDRFELRPYRDGGDKS